MATSKEKKFEKEVIEKLRIGEDLTPLELKTLVDNYSIEEKITGSNDAFEFMATVIEIQGRHFFLSWDKEKFVNDDFNDNDEDDENEYEAEAEYYFEMQPKEIHQEVRAISCWVNSMGDVVF